MSEPLLVSVVVPVNNEAPHIAPLVEEIHAALKDKPYELMYVDDGSSDDSWPVLLGIKKRGEVPLRLFQHPVALGQSTAMYQGALHARGQWLVFLDGDGQNVPADVPKLLDALAQAGGNAKMAIGHRVERRDSGIKRISSRVANRVRAWLLKDDTPDTGCGLKVIDRELFLKLPYFNHMHRFMPALAQRHGSKTLSVPVQHRPRDAGKSHYGTLDRLFHGMIDLLGVVWLIKRNRWQGLVPEVEAGVAEANGDR